jgi:mono/diheme cytochrome c family protein
LAAKVLLSLVVLFILIFAAFYARVEMKRTSKVDVALSAFSIPEDQISIETGRRLVQVKACADCHEADLGGFTFINEPPLAVFTGTNLTGGRGSAVRDYEDVDWIRSIRYGIGRDKRPLMGMPAGDFHGISDQDLGRMIAYLKSLPPVDRENPRQKAGPIGIILYNLGQLPLMFPYEEIDLKSKPVAAIEAEVSVKYGAYLANGCTGCHGPAFSGGHIPGTPPSWPDAKNLTPSGAIANWSLPQFKKVLVEGITPEGHQINSQYMPWKSMQAMTDVEIEALYIFLKQLPARKEGTR